MSIEGTIKAINEPAVKLIEVVRSVIGKMYEPHHHKKMTDAEVYRISEYSKAIKENSDLPIVLAGDNLSIDITDYDELVKRTGNRLMYQELRKQKNIENVIDMAYDEISTVTEDAGNDGTISPEWMNRYINMVGEVSTESMQKLWAKILSGEVVNPNSYSMKTMETLRNMSVADVDLFKQVSELVISGRYIFSDNDLNSKYGIAYNDILALDSCGLINSSGIISLQIKTNGEPTVAIDFGSYILLVSSEKNATLRIGQFPLSRAGKELLRLTGNHELSYDYIKGVAQAVRAANKNIKVSLHRVEQRNEEELSYEEKEIALGDDGAS